MPFSPQYLLDLYVKHQEAIDFVAKSYGTANGVTHSALRAVVARAYYHENHKRLQEFMYVVDSGYAVTPNDDAAIALRNFYLQNKSIRNSNSGIGRELLFFKTLS